MALTVILPSGVSNTGNFAFGSVSTTGNITGNYILGNGALLTGVSTTSSNINNGTSNVTVVSSGGNVTVGIGGTGNVAVFATTGEYITGLLSVSGNVTGGNLVTSGSGGNISGANVISGTTLSATGNVVANNVVATTIVNAASHTGTIVSVSGNINGGNLITTGIAQIQNNLIVNAPAVGEGGQLILAWANTPNVTGQANQTWNLDVDSSNVFRVFYQNSAGAAGVMIQANAASNIVQFTQSAGISVSGNVNAGTNYFIGNGSQLTGISGGGGGANIANGTSNVTVVTSGGNVTVGIGGTGNVAVFATTGEYITGLLSVTGNAIANNGIFTNIVNTASFTGAVVSVSGNITGGNLNTTGVLSTSGNVVANNVVATTIVNAASYTGTIVSVSGNITGSQLTANNGLIINSTTVSSNATIGSGYNAMSVGPMAINSGISVTVASGQRWLIF